MPLRIIKKFLAMSCLDLRMQNNHQVAEFKDSKSTSFIRQMRIRSNYILSEKFGGEVGIFILNFNFLNIFRLSYGTFECVV